MKPNNSEEFIKWLFMERCVIDTAPFSVIHEIRPRSSGKEAMEWKNRVTLCSDCHRQIHKKGVGEEEILALQQIRAEFLKMIGRESYT